ncbi:PREDICTED: uncharacterized protein LOC107332619 isoform X2 [Acropora digitifera]|uniref:uncharacterized protein LOC107332619 isoform X2 n=1 Tax=Acropora digitifera TaxID=70779 RepID=UPI00077A29C0|nr:PREDICTED: uncharacterized protein LOC107332619 isoform X2 [Acropora digitifera]
MEIKYLKQYLNQPRHLFTLNILQNVTLRPHWSDIPLVSLANMMFSVWLELGETIMEQKKWLESYTYIKSCNRDSLWLLNWYLQLENLCLNASKVMDPLCKLKFFTITDIGFINDVRLAMRHLPAAAHHNCGVPGNIHEAHFSFRPSRSSVSDDSTTFRRNKGYPKLSEELHRDGATLPRDIL